VYSKVRIFLKRIPGIKFLRNKIREVIDSHSFLKRVVFYGSRFLVMHGLPPLWYVGNRLKHWEEQDISESEGTHPYLVIEGSTRMMFRDILEVVDRETSFLEVGCNAGRNLQYLMEQGFRNLAGIDINKIGIHNMMKEHFRELYQSGKFFVGDAFEQIKHLASDSYDVVFAHSVLSHIPSGRRKLFEEMVRVSSKYIVVLSEENSPTLYPYDFRKIFEKAGCKEIVSRAFYSGPKGDFLWGNTGYKLPTELFDTNPNFFETWTLKIFVKSR